MNIGAECYYRFLNGDNSGLEELVKMFNDNLILFINGYVKNLAIAEDLAADTFAELIVKRSPYIEKYSFKTWLFRIARNNAIDYIRKYKRHSHIALSDSDAAEEDALESSVVRSEQQEELRACLKKIKKDYSDVLYLIYFEEMSYQEAGLVLKKNNKQIKNLVFRAKQALRETMIKEGFNYEEL